jgi:hypothetical protein
LIKEYLDLKSAYDVSCPICNSSMFSMISDTNYFDDPPYPPYPLTVKLKFKNKYAADDYVVLNIHNGTVAEYSISSSKDREISNNVSSIICGYDPDSITDNFESASKYQYMIKYDIFMAGHRVNCQVCCQYAYVLQLHISLAYRKVIKILLNSEDIAIEEGSDVHEIRNVYTMNKTEYYHSSNDPSKNHIKSKRLDLPLISDSLKNPQEVLSRIKKLLIFS